MLILAQIYFKIVMKNIILLFICSVILTGCATHNGLTDNRNIHGTQVVLSERNFKVVANVKGESETTYVFGFGGLSRSAMIAEAKAQILERADMIGKSRALVNETVEVKSSVYLIVMKRKVTVTAQVVEFVNPPTASTNRGTASRER